MQTTARRRSPIGWPEILIGLIAFYALGHTTTFAVAVRIRRLKPFGFTRTTTKGLLLAALGDAATHTHSYIWR